MDTNNIFFFVWPFMLLFSAQGNVLERSKRQYGTDDYDPVTGAFIGECTFYGDYTADCTGRLTCRPSDVEDRPTSSFLDRTCPKTIGTKSGKWERDQVVPSNMIPRDAGSGRICKCQFYANRQTGNFKCTSVQGDTWKGTHTGSLNTAFRLGLSAISPSYDSNYGSGRGTESGATGDDDTYPRYGSGTSGRDYSYTTYSPYSSGRERGSVYDRDQDRGTGRDTYSGGRYSTDINANDRDSSYRDNDATGSRDRYQTSYRGTDNYDRDRETRYPAQATTSNVIMCTYYNDGKGTCRDCTERVDRKETSTEIRTTKHYTCSGPETKTTWAEGSGVMSGRAGMRPDPYTYTKKMVATCMYRPDDGKTFECHASSTDGACGTTNDGYGASGSTSYGTSGTPQRCLGGEKWTGRYYGNIY